LGRHAHGRFPRQAHASRAQELRQMFDPVMVCSECGEPLAAKHVHVHPGPGARQVPAASLKAEKAG